MKRVVVEVEDATSVESVDDRMKAVMAAGAIARSKPGRKVEASVDGTINKFLRSKRFREQCRDFLLNDDKGVLSGHEKGGFQILKEIAVGGKKTKASDQLAALTLMAKVSGELKENITVERVDPLADMKQEELLEMAKESVKALETKAPKGAAWSGAAIPAADNKEEAAK